MVPVNTVDMTHAARDFVFEMVDKVKAYGTRHRNSPLVR